MQRFSVAQAKARLSEIIHKVEGGEEVVITRRGEPVVRLLAAKEVRPLKTRTGFRAEGPTLRTPAAQLVRGLRDSSRY